MVVTPSPASRRKSAGHLLGVPGGADARIGFLEPERDLRVDPVAGHPVPVAVIGALTIGGAAAAGS